MAEDATEWRFVTLRDDFVFEALASDTGLLEPDVERGICCMATEPNQDPPLIWRKSGASGGTGSCVEVAKSASSVQVRDSRNRTGTVLKLSCAQWRSLVQRIRDGEAV
jgi:hypothetical protein